MGAGQIIQNVTLGLVPSLIVLIGFLLKRRPEIRNLDADADTKAVTSAGVIMDRLERDVARTREQVTALEKQLQEERAASTRQLNAAHAEIGRLGGLVASLRVDQGISQGQIEQLQKRLAGSTFPDDTIEHRRP